MQSGLLSRDELVSTLRSFQAFPVIERYRQDWVGKTPAEILSLAVDRKIYRAFAHETPSQRYAGWRWHKEPEVLLGNLNALRSQEEFNQFSEDLGESLVATWGEKNDRGEPSRMNIGVAMKIINVVLKHLYYSEHEPKSDLGEGLLHVPWDRFTLEPLRRTWQGDPCIPSAPSQGFVKTLALYRALQSCVSGIAKDAGVPRIWYEFWAWDWKHQADERG